MKQKLHKISMAAVAVVVFGAALSLNLEKNDKGSWEFALVKSFAQGGESDDPFRYAIDNQTCKLIVKTKAQAGLVLRLFSMNVSVGGVADVTNFTKLYRPGGSYRLGSDVTCSDLFMKVANGGCNCGGE